MPSKRFYLLFKYPPVFGGRVTISTLGGGTYYYYCQNWREWYSVEAFNEQWQFIKRIRMEKSFSLEVILFGWKLNVMVLICGLKANRACH